MSSSTQEEVLQIFRESRALLTGHFVLRSGLHSGHFFQCAQVCQYLDKVTRLIELLRPKLAQYPCDVVLAPAMGGLVVGQELARQLGVRFIFVEKENDRLVLRRNFSFQPHERVLIAEDVVFWSAWRLLRSTEQNQLPWLLWWIVLAVRRSLRCHFFLCWNSRSPLIQPTSCPPSWRKYQRPSPVLELLTARKAPLFKEV